RARALVDDEPGAGDLRAAREVEDVEVRGDVPVRAAAPGRATGRRVGAALAFEGLIGGKLLAPGPNGDDRVLAADGHVRIRRVRDPEEEILDLGLDRRELGVDR